MSDIEAKNLFELGLKSLQENNLDDAESKFVKALLLSPKRPSILRNLSIVYFKKQNYDDAYKTLKLLEEIEEFDDELNIFYFELLKHLDLKDELESFFKKKSFLIKKNNYFDVFKKLTYPNFFLNDDDIKAKRSKLNYDLDELLDTKKITFDLDKEIFEPPIYNLSYDQHQNLEINKKIVKLFRKIYPQLNQSFENKGVNGKIKIGFLSQFFDNHTIAKLFKGLIFKLDQSVYDVVVFHSLKTRKTPMHQEFLNFEINSNIKNITLPAKFSDKVSIINKENLDIAFFPDIGMSTEFYYLSFIRFAKIQMTSWGHPITSANDSIDYFLSSEQLKSKHDKDYFSEKFLYLKKLPMFFYNPIIQKKLNDEEILNNNIYFCSQTLIKFHPHFDEIINRILKKDKKAKLFIIQDQLFNKIDLRLKKNISENIDRVTFLKKLSYNDYINQCGQSSVLLDTLYFGAGNSFHESMFYGTPTVTLPSEDLKSRIVFGAYKQMRIEDAPIVKNSYDYVEKAVELANLDKNKMLDYKKMLNSNAMNYLYEQKQFISEMNSLFSSLHKHL